MALSWDEFLELMDGEGYLPDALEHDEPLHDAFGVDDMALVFVNVARKRLGERLNDLRARCQTYRIQAEHVLFEDCTVEGFERLAGKVFNLRLCVDLLDGDVKSIVRLSRELDSRDPDVLEAARDWAALSLMGDGEPAEALGHVRASDGKR